MLILSYAMRWALTHRSLHPQSVKNFLGEGQLVPQTCVNNYWLLSHTYSHALYNHMIQNPLVAFYVSSL